MFAIATIVCLSFFVQSIIGFGGALLATPLLSLLLPVRDAVTLVLLFQVAIGIIFALTQRATNWKILIPVIIGMVVGIVFGNYILLFSPEQVLRKVLALSIIIYLVEPFLSKKNLDDEPKKTNLIGFVAGALGGIIQGAVGQGGPIFVMHLQSLRLDKKKFRSGIFLILLLANLVRLPLAISTGLANRMIIADFVQIFPFFLVALFLGNFIHKKINEIYFTRLVKGVLLTTAIFLLVY